MFRGQQSRLTVDALGSWSVDLPGGDDGGLFELRIHAANRIDIKDIHVGDNHRHYM